MADAQVIDQLAIEITTHVKNEAKLKRFSDALDNLATVSHRVNTNNLQTTAYNVKSFANALNGIKTNDVRLFANAIHRLSLIKADNVGGLDAMAKSLVNLTNSATNTEGLNRLVNALARLTNAKSALASGKFDVRKFTQLGNALTGVTQSLAGAGDIDGGIVRLVNGIAKLADAGSKIKVATSEFPKFGSRLTALVKNLQGVGTIQKTTADLVTAISSLANAGKKAGEVTGSLDKFGDAVVRLVKKLQGVGNVNGNLAQTIAGLGNLAQGGMKFGNAFQYTTRETTNLGNGLKRLGSVALRVISPFNSFGEKLGKVKKQSKGLASTIGLLYAKYWLLKRAIGGIGKMTGSAQDYIEAFNYFNVALQKIGKDSKDQYKRFGYDNATEYAESFQDRFTELQKTMTGYDVNSRTGDLNFTGERNLGLNIKDVMEYQAQIAQITNSTGQLGEVSIMAAKSMSMLAADMSSLTNTDLVQVQENFMSALNGQTRAVYKYGINLTSASLQQIAYNHGINESVAKLSMASKQQLRLIGMLEQSKVAWGDLNRTLDQPANQLRRLQSGFANLARTIGSLFLPLLNVVYPVLNAIVMVLQEFFGWIAKLVGAKMPDMSSALKMPDISTPAEDAGTLADNTGKAAKNAKKLNDNIQGFDEINKLQADNDNSGSGGGGGAGGGLGDIDLSKDIQDLLNQLNKKWGSGLTDKAADLAKKIKQALIDGWNKGGDFTDLGERFGKWITDGLNKIPWAKIRATVRKIVRSFATFINGTFKGADWNVIGNTVAQGLNTVVDALYEWWTTIDWLDLGTRLAKGINSVIKNFDWKKFGGMLGARLRGMIQFAFGLITNIDFKQLGTKISDAINSFFEKMGRVDPRTGLSGWAELGKTVSDGAKGILDTILEVLDKVDWDAVAKAISDFLGQIDWVGIFLKLGKVIVKALWTAIKTAVKAFANDPLGVGGAIVTVLGGLFAFGKLKGLVGIIKSGFGKVFGLGIKGAVSSSGIASAVGTVGASGGTGLVGKLFGKIFNSIKRAGSGIAASFRAAFNDKKILDVFTKGGTSLGGSLLAGIKGALTASTISTALGTGILGAAAIIAGKIGTDLINEYYDEREQANTAAKSAGKSKATADFAVGRANGKKDIQILNDSINNAKSNLDSLKKRYSEGVKWAYDHPIQYTFMGKGENLQYLEDQITKEEARIKNLNDQYTKARRQSIEKNEKKVDKYRENALKRLSKLAEKGKISWYDFLKAQNAVNESTGKTKDIFANAITKTDAYKTATRNLATAMSNANVPYEQQKGILKKLQDALKDGRISLKEYQKICKNSKGDVHKLNQEIGKIPEKKTTTVNVKTSGMGKVLRDLKSISKDISVKVRAQVITLGAGNTQSKQSTRTLLDNNFSASSINQRIGKTFKINKDGSVSFKKGYADEDIIKLLKENGINYKVVKKFAQGGFIEDGVFTMNRGEIAGKFNNGTSVVANNQQISDGFAKSITQTLAPAMYSAVKQAVSEASIDGGQDIKVYLDGKQIAENNVKYIRQMNRASGRTQFA